MPEVRRIRCSSCGYAAPAEAVWAINNLCPRCLAPLSLTVDTATPIAAMNGDGEALEGVVLAWAKAFNDRDLDGMLARMSPDVDFHPLRLGRVDGAYLGHDGVREWFDQLMADERQHTLEILEFRDGGKDRAIALGNLRLDHRADAVPFWALDRFKDGLIAAAHHYLTDADILEHGRLFDL
jgi:ketosteroid isomerase-like protein